MNNESIIMAALRALPSDNMRKEEMLAIECALRMAVDLVAGGVPTRPNGDAEGTIRELTVECIARARRIDELEKEIAGLVSDNERIGVDRGMAIEAIGDGVDVTNSLRKELDEAKDAAEDWRLKAGQRSIELAQAHNETNKRLRELWKEQAALQKERGSLLFTISNLLDFNSELQEEIKSLKRGDMFERGEMASMPSGWGDIPHEVAS